MLDLHNYKQDFAETTTALLPVGALEQHGSHLPVGTDTLLAEVFGRRIAKRLDAYLLPVIGIASSIEHSKSRATVYLKAETLGLVVRDIAESLQRSGFRRLIVLNAHGGNWILKPTIRQINHDLKDFIAILVHSDPPESRLGEVLDHTENEVHAGEGETSLMHHFFADLVKPPVVPETRTFHPQSYLDYLDTTELTEDGYWGYPEAATADKGSRLAKMIEEGILDYIARIEKTLAAHGK